MTPVVLKRLRVRLGIVAVMCFAIGFAPRIVHNAIAGGFLFGIVCGLFAAYVMTLDLGHG